MKNKLTFGILALIITGMLFSCNSNKKNNENKKVAVDGSGIEIIFKEVNKDGDIVVTISNHMESNLNEFYAKVIWLDENGNTFEGFGEEPDYFPVQQIDKNMVLSGEKKDFTTMMNLELAPEGTKSAKIELIYAKFADKTEWTPEKQ